MKNILTVLVAAFIMVLSSAIFSPIFADCAYIFQNWTDYSSKIFRTRSDHLKLVDAEVKKYNDNRNNRFPNLVRLKLADGVLKTIENWNATKETTSIRQKEMDDLINCIKLDQGIGIHDINNLEKKESREVAELSELMGDTHKYQNTSGSGQSGKSGSYFDFLEISSASGIKRTVQGIFKPITQEGSIGAGAFKEGAAALREAMAYTIARKLGLDVVPPTRLAVIKDDVLTSGGKVGNYASLLSTQIGSYQKGVADVSGDLSKHLAACQNVSGGVNYDYQSLQKIAVLDMILLNNDRHAENVMLQVIDVDTNTFRIAAIDHGQAFPTFYMVIGKMNNPDSSGYWDWSKIKESEIPFSALMKRKVNEINNFFLSQMKNMAFERASTLSNATGDRLENYEISDESWNMVKLSIATLKAGIEKDLSPAQMETIYKKRGTNWVSKCPDRYRTLTGKGSGIGGEFGTLLSELNRSGKLRNDEMTDREISREVAKMMQTALARLGEGDRYQH